MEVSALERIKEIEKLAESHNNGILFHPDNKYGLVSADDVPFLLKACRVWREIAIENGVIHVGSFLPIDTREGVEKAVEERFEERMGK